MYFLRFNLTWLALAGSVLVQVRAVPVSGPPSPSPSHRTSSSESENEFPILPYNHGDIVGVRPGEYEHRPPKEISIHPGVVVDGPKHNGKYSIAMISKKLPHNPPQEDIRNFHPHADIYGNVALSPPKEARPKGMKPWKSEETGETASPMKAHGLRMLKAAMGPHQNWRPPTPPPFPENSQPKGRKSGKGRKGNYGANPGPSNPPHQSPQGPPMQHQPAHRQAGPSQRPYYPSNPLHHAGPPPARYDSTGHHPPAFPPTRAPSPPSGKPYPYRNTGAPPQRPSDPYKSGHKPPPPPPVLYGSSSHHPDGGPAVQFPTPHHFTPPHPFQRPQNNGPAYGEHPPRPPGGVVYQTGPALRPPQHLGRPNPYPLPPVHYVPPLPGPYHDPHTQYSQTPPGHPYHPNAINPPSRGHSSRPPPYRGTNDQGKWPAKRMRR